MKLLQTKDEETKEEYKRMNREVKQQVVKKKNHAWEKRCECIDNQLRGTQSSEAWKTVKAIKTTNRTQIFLNNIPETKWIEHFMELLVEPRNDFISNDHEIKVSGGIALGIEEVQEAIKDTKLRKSPGPGGINPELVRYGPPKLFEMLRKLFERCLNGEEVPIVYLTGS